MEIIEALDRRRRRTSLELLLRQFKVTATSAGPPPTVTIEDNGPVEGVRYLSSYSPSVGDTVWAIVDEPDIIILGELA